MCIHTRIKIFHTHVFYRAAPDSAKNQDKDLEFNQHLLFFLALSAINMSLQFANLYLFPYHNSFDV